MTKIYQVSGPSMGARKKGFTLLNHDIGEITEGHMDLLIARDRQIAKRDIINRKRGIGSVRSLQAENTIEMLDDAIYGLSTADPLHYMGKIEESILAGEYSHHELAGVSCPKTIGRVRRANRIQRRAKRAQEMQAETIEGIGSAIGRRGSRTGKTGGFLKRAAQKTQAAFKNVATKVQQGAQNAGGGLKNAGGKLKNLGGKILKVASLPARLAAKGVLEILLPQAAPFFLYLFINDPKIIAKLPAKVKRKRNKALLIKNFIVNVIGMKDSHFMGICRNGIMKKMGASPETILSGLIKSISGIGVVGISLAVAAKAVPIVINIITKLVQAFKRNKGEGLDPSADDAPSADDFEGVTPQEATELSSDIKKQNDLPEPGDDVQKNTGADSATNVLTSQGESGGGSTYNGSRGGGGNSGGGGGSNIQPDSQADSSSADSSSSGGGSGTSTTAATKESQADPAVDENGEIKKEPFETGGRKGWSSL